MDASCTVSWEEGIETLRPDDPKLLVTSSVSLPSWVSSLDFHFVLIESVWRSVVDFPLLRFVVLLIMIPLDATC